LLQKQAFGCSKVYLTLISETFLLFFVALESNCATGVNQFLERFLVENSFLERVIHPCFFGNNNRNFDGFCFYIGFADN
jgi:hypothetical protein